MTNLLLPRREILTQQPTACRIAWDNPICRGLVVAVAGDNLRSNIALNSPMSVIGSTARTITRDGVCADFTSSLTQGVSVGTSAIFNPTEITLFSIYTPKSSASSISQTLFARDDNSLGRAFTLDLHGSVGRGVRYYVAGGGAAGTNELSENVSVSVGRRYVVVARQAGSAAALFVDNNLVGSSAAFTAKPSATGDTRIGMRTYSGFNSPADGEIPLSLMWNRALSNAEVRSISQNPWQIFTPQGSRLFVPVSAGGSPLTAAASGGAVAGGSASLAAQVALAAVGVTVAGGSAAAAASIPLSATGFAVSSGTANAVATVTISAAGLAQAAGTANLSGGAAGSISATGQAQASGSALLNITVTLSATGSSQSSGSANLSGGAPGQVSASGGAQAGGSAQIKATVSISAAGYAQAMASGQLSIQIPLSAFGGAISAGSAHLVDAGGSLILTRAPAGQGPIALPADGYRPQQSSQSRPGNTGGRRL